MTLAVKRVTFALMTIAVLALAAFHAMPAFAALAPSAAEGASGDGAVLARRVIADGLYNIGSISRSGYSVAVKGGSAKTGANVATSARKKSDWAQKWALTWDDETGYYKIRNLGSRKFLGVAGTVKSGAAIKQYGSAGSASRLWEPIETSAGIMFKSAGTGYALAVSGGAGGAPALKLALVKSAGLASQTFKLRTVDPLEAGKSYFIRSVSSGKRLNVMRDSTKSGAKIGLSKAASVKSQKFRILKAGSAYRIQCVRSCRYVGVKGASSVRQLAGKSGANKKWTIGFDLESAAFSIADKSGRLLSVVQGGLALDSPANGRARRSQQFALSPTYAFKLFLNPGHGANSNGNGAWDPGAIGSGHTEAELTHDLAKRVGKLLAGTDVKVIDGSKYKLAFWRRMPKAAKLGCDAIVSIHFDAGGGSGTLKMVGMQGKAPGSDALARYVHAGVVSKLGLGSRGLSSRSDITCVNGPIPSMLTEVCFVDNDYEVGVYLKKRDAVAKGLAAGIVKASRSRAVVR